MVCSSFYFSVGFSLNNPLHQIIVARYTEPNLTIDFDNFVCSLIRLESLFSEFLSLWCHFLSTSLQIYYAQLYFLVFTTDTFKTLDKNESGTIKLGFMEVRAEMWWRRTSSLRTVQWLVLLFSSTVAESVDAVEKRRLLPAGESRLIISEYAVSECQFVSCVLNQ